VKIGRVLLCVDGSPSALEAARLTVDLAIGWNAVVRAVYVVQDSVAAQAIDAAAAGHLPPAEQRLAVAAGDVLAYVAHLGRAQGVEIETIQLLGDPFREILREARSYYPDMIVIGLAGRRGPGPVVIGTVMAQLLEFTEWPVIVVPARASGRVVTNRDLSAAEVPARDGGAGSR
jgi:nucleotide-binding universal stress UspA family protein